MTNVSGLTHNNSSSSVPALVCIRCQGTGRSGRIDNYFGVSLTASQVAAMHVLLIEMIVDCALPFSLVSRNSFRRFVDRISPKTSLLLPAHTKVRELLHDAAAAA